MAPKNKEQKIDIKPTTKKDFEVKTGKDKRVVVRPEQVEDHEAFSDRVWSWLGKR